MSNLIYRSILKPIRKNLSFQERWNGLDIELITCWEVGRKLRENDPDLATQATNGELPPLGWKGGVKKKTLYEIKYGSLNYLAQWQGLRGEDLKIDISIEREVICSKTKIKVIFTADTKKYVNP